MRMLVLPPRHGDRVCVQAQWIYRNLRVFSAPPFPTLGRRIGARLDLPTGCLLSHQVPLPLPAPLDTQHPPLLVRPARLGRALVLRRGHCLAPRRPQLAGLLSDKDTAWLPPGRRHPLGVPQPRTASHVQQGPRMAAGRWPSHLHNAQVGAGGQPSLLF